MFHLNRAKQSILFLLFIFFLSHNKALACHETNISVISTIDNGNGTYDITVQVCIGTLEDTYGFEITFNGANILSVNTPCITGANTICAGTPSGGTVEYGDYNNSGAPIYSNGTVLCNNMTFTVSAYPTSVDLYGTELTYGFCGSTASLPTLPSPPTVINTCSGTFTDGNGNYSSNANDVYTYCSNNGGPIQLDFTAFDLETNWDFMYIYDGASTASPPIGTYTGTTGPGIIVSSGSCITIHFTSDGIINWTGWSANISCPCTPPSLSNNTVNETCEGYDDGSIDLSVTGGTTPYTYNWSNGANTQDISALADGSYTVTVTTNDGCEAIETINISAGLALPIASFTHNGPLCEGSSIDFTNTGDSPNSCGGGCPTFSWDYDNGNTSSGTNGGAANPSQTFATAGTYNVTLTVSNGSCINQAILPVIITSPPVLSISPTHETCAGSNDGAGSLTITGGTSPFTFDWSNGATTQNISSLSDGQYSVTVTDNAGCVATATTTINAGNSPTANFTYNGDFCLGTNNINFTNTGTTGGGATYSWTFTGGTPATSTDQNPTGITWGTANTFNVSLTVTQGPCTDTYSQNITINPDPSVTATGTNVDCNGNTTGSVSATGSADVTGYSWDNGLPGNSGPHTGLGIGTYNVTVTNANGCQATDSYTITQPNALTITLDLCQDVSAPSAADGAVSITPTGGTSPYTYLWSNGATTQDISGLSGGTYTVTVTDDNGCPATATCIVIEPGCTLTATAISTNASCAGVNDGTATVTPAGGASPFTYLWDDPTGQTTVVATGLAGGITYTVTVTDNNSCTATASVTVNNNIPGIASITLGNNVTGNGLCNGQATAVMTGGTSPFTYTWSGPSNSQTTATATNLCAGNHCVTITDNNGCFDTDCITIIEPPPLAAAIVGTNVNCNGDCTGSADLTVTGGISPYTYNWSHGPTAQDPINLCAGNYDVTVTDANLIEVIASVTITEPSAFTVSDVVTDVLCNGQCTGAIDLTVSGATAGYSYSWSNTQTTQDILSLCANTYDVTITDALGCDTILQYDVIEPPPISLSFSTVNANCGQTDGSATVTVTGGSSPYSYLWDAAANNQVVFLASDLSIGTYFVTVTDNNGCPVVGSASVGNNAGVSISASVDIHVSCNSGTNGQATATMSGGLTPYSLAWSTTPTQNSNTATGLVAGTHSVTVTDGNGCTDISTVNITEPSALTSINSTNPTSCFGVCDGSATVTISGGTSGYTYQWDDPGFQTTATATGLCHGTFNVTITDINSCQIFESLVVSQPAELILSSDSTSSACGVSDGTATVTVLSGAFPYSYTWDASAGSQTTATATGLPGACYNVTVTDANSCQATRTICVTDLGSPSVTLLNQTNTSCNGICDGFAQVSVSGGTPAYTFNWLDYTGTPIGQSTASGSNLCAGTYTCEVTDASNCVASLPVVITEPNILGASITGSINATCFGYCDGQATVSASGGTTSYNYQWNDPALQTTPTATGLCIGNYNVTVTDANGCDSILPVSVSEPDQMTLTVNTTAAFCNTPSGQACVTITDGISPYTYGWNDPALQTTSCANNLVPGIYSITVTDNNGCQANATGVVTNIPPGTASISSSTDATCNGICDGTATVSMGGAGTAPFTYNWMDASYNTIGQTNITANGLCAATYHVEVTDANGCKDTATVIIAVPSAMAVTMLTTNPVCFGSCDGTITANVSGGASPYSYVWNDPLAQTVIKAIDLCANSYAITITDANGCSIIDSASLTNPAAILLDSVVINASCNQSNGSACVSVTGGTSPYTYTWPSSNTGSCETNISANSYVVTVTDFNSCSETITIVVQNNSAPSISLVNTVDIDCFGNCTGTAQVNITGGTGPSTIEWFDNLNNPISQNTPIASNLCEGSYSAVVTDSVGCSSAIPVTINEPSEIQYNKGFLDPLCYNDCNGSAWVTVTGGTTPYSYSWSGSTVNNDTISNLCSGNISLTITDANGCIAVDVFTLNNPAQVTSITTSTNALCNGVCDGTISITPVTGTAPFTFLWSDANSQTTQTAIGLCYGSYQVTVSDANGCNQIDSGFVNEPTLLQANITNSENVSCSGVCDGFAEVTGTGGTPPYAYLWNDLQNTQTAVNLCATLYTVTVSDANNCIDSVSITINDPTALSSSISAHTDVICGGTCTGSATVTGGGGTAPYTYLWDVNAAFQTTATATGLCGGNFDVTITDNNGCTSVSSATIFEPIALTIDTNSIQNASCNLSNGSICMNVIGGTVPYTYQWNDPFTQTGACAQNLFAGCYTLVVTDANGCTATALACINNDLGPNITLVNSSDLLCYGDTNGMLEFTVAGGATPYADTVWVDINGDTLSQINSTVALNLSGGTYTMLIQDASGCIVSSTQVISAPTQIVSAVTSYNNTSCYGGNDGWASVGYAGGTPGYTFQWNDPGNQTSSTANGLTAGTFSVIVTDANGCSSTSSQLISEPNQIVLNSTVDSTNCNGSPIGSSIVINATGGTGSYLYNWSPMATPNSQLFNVAAGNYSVTVTDANGCSQSINSIVYEPDSLTSASTTIDATCSQCNGEATLFPTGGTSPYSYTWLSGNQTTATATGLCAGTIHVTITDANNCILSSGATINNQSGPDIIDINSVGAQCNGFSNGSATVTYINGTPPFGYLWSDGQTGLTATNINAGGYSVTVTDSNNCVADTFVNVIQPAPLISLPNGDDTLCFGQPQPGQLWGSASGGTPPYTYNWIGTTLTGSGPHPISPTTSINYTLEITDDSGCVDTANFFVFVHPELTVQPNPSLVDICEGDSVNICANVLGGNGGPMYYNWADNNGLTYSNQNCQYVNPSDTTIFTVTVTDNCSADATTQITVNVNPLPVVNLVGLPLAGCEPYSANFITTGLISDNYTYNWDFEADGIIDSTSTTPTTSFTYIHGGLYTVNLSVSSPAPSSCFYQISFTNYVEVYNQPYADFYAIPAIASILNPEIEFNAFSSNNYDSLIWDFDDGSPMNTTVNPTVSHIYSDTGTFNVILTAIKTHSYDTCIASATIPILIEGEFAFYAPNAFTPGINDNLNNVFRPKGYSLDPTYYTLTIYDRWGDIVYESYQIDQGWPGTHQETGNMLPLGVYVWQVVTRDISKVDKPEKKFIGHVTLIE